MVSVDYSIRTTGDVDTINNPSFIVRAVRIVNNSGDAVIFDNGIDTPISVPVGTTPVFNQEHLITTFKTHTASNTTGYAVAVVYDSPQDESTNPPLQQLPGIVSSSQAPGTTFNITPAANAIFSVNPGAGALFTITPGVNAVFTITPGVGTVFTITPGAGTIFTVTPSGSAVFNIQAAAGATFTVVPSGAAVFVVNPAGGAIFTVSGSVTITSGSVTINNTNPLTIINPDTVASYSFIDNATITVTLTRQAQRLTIQPVLTTLSRGGLLTVTATDSTTQTYEFLEGEYIPYANSQSSAANGNRIIPFDFLYAMKSGAVLSVRFTGACGFIVGY